MHEFSSSVNNVNKAVAKVRKIGDRLPLKDKPGVDIIIDHSRDHTVVNGL